MSTFIENGQVYSSGKLLLANLVLDDGKIQDITEERVTCQNYIDATGKVILPGFIDCHVHLPRTKLSEEDFVSCSQAAAAGGVTTVLLMPDTVPPTTSIPSLEEKRELARKNTVNYGFHLAATSENLEEIDKARNFASVTVFLEESRPDLWIDQEQLLKRIFATSKRIAVHGNAEQTAQAIKLIKETKNRLYLCHVSSVKGIGMLKKYLKGKVFAEATPRHLFLSSENSATDGNPGLGTKADQDALWNATSQGLVDTVGSGHLHGSEGVSAVEITLPLLFNAFCDDRMPLTRIVELCCENPAKIFGIRNKGFIRIGADADLVIVDPNLVKEVHDQHLPTTSKGSPFQGWKLRGWPVMTIVNGTVVFDHKGIVGAAGREVRFILGTEPQEPMANPQPVAETQEEQ